MGMRDLLLLQTRRWAEDGNDARFIGAAAKLMHQQCWCWGCDIRRPKGNLLLEFGFERTRPPAGAAGSSCYRVRLSSGRSVSLWGFGALIADQGSTVFLDRFRFAPQWRAAQEAKRECWAPSDLPPLRRPLLSRELTLVGNLASELVSFIGDYESWVAETFGIHYRQQTIGCFEQRAFSAIEAKSWWPRLAKQLTRHYSRQAANVSVNYATQRNWKL